MANKISLSLVSFIFSVLVIFSLSNLSHSLVDNSTISENSFKEISIRGTISSNRDAFQDTGLGQSYFILPLRDDNATYSGTFTFTSTKPIQIQSFNILSVNNSLKLPIQYGTLYTVPINGSFLVSSDLLNQPQNTGTVQFSGNVLRAFANEPFIITYSFSGKIISSVVANNLSSALNVYKEITGTKT
ncbi:MAG: hypothetical protein H0X50_00870 [Nitrosopumilus sp.]|nr:hypothetical protein [Nitrosopumilus sp.]